MDRVDKDKKWEQVQIKVCCFPGFAIHDPHIIKRVSKRERERERYKANTTHQYDGG
jgi:hypothetical protein